MVKNVHYIVLFLNLTAFTLEFLKAIIVKPSNKIQFNGFDVSERWKKRGGDVLKQKLEAGGMKHFSMN